MALFVKTVSNCCNSDVRRVVFSPGITKQMLKMLKMNMIHCLKFLMKSLLLDFYSHLGENPWKHIQKSFDLYFPWTEHFVLYCNCKFLWPWP